jgi:hypothetical protein
MMIYHITDEIGTKLSSNAQQECLDCILECSKSCAKTKCPKDRKEKRIGKIFDDKVIIFLCDEKYVNSSKMFKKRTVIAKQLLWGATQLFKFRRKRYEQTSIQVTA